MNIKFEMDNFYTRYLKRFLSHELSYSYNVLGPFNKEDQKLLIQYLNLPNVENMSTALKTFKEKFTDLNDLFTIKTGHNSITFIGRELSQTIVDYIENNKADIEELCKSMGWELSNVNEYLDITKDINLDDKVDNDDITLLTDMIIHPNNYTVEQRARGDLNFDGYTNNTDLSILTDYIGKTKLYFTIKQADRKNYFPNKDMLVFVNQFDGTFKYNYALRSNYGVDDKPHINPDMDTKLGVYRCKPGQKLTITHNSNFAEGTRLVIGSTPINRLDDLENFICDNVIDVTLKPGQFIEYTTSSIEEGTGLDAEFVLIQVPSNYEQLTDGGKVTIPLDVGDINFDGVINMEDYYILAQYTATGPGSEDLPYNKVNWTPSAKQLAVMNIDASSSEIDKNDADLLYNFVNDTTGSIPSLGFVYYTYNDPEVQPTGNNVSNLLIIDGFYDKTTNIPFKDFVVDNWIVHEKFFNYLLDMAIQPYSDPDTITYLQKLMKQVYPNVAYDKSVFYNGKYSEKMRDLMYNYQRSFTNYTLGDMNIDGKLDYLDLNLLEEFINKYKNIYLIQDYLDNKIDLTPEQIALLDTDNNGLIDNRDLRAWKQRIDAEYTPLFIERADVNDDGLYNQADYDMLKLDVDGLTHNLQNYSITFMLGYLDVQTENLLEQEANATGDISEVSK